VKAFPEKLAFKGGTCAYFFYNLPRFSFDLDFDMRAPFSPTDMDKLREVVSRHGRFKEFYDKQFTLFGVFDYGKGHPNIKIEVNKRLWNNNIYKAAWFLGAALFIPDEATLLTNKLVAVTDRKAAVARDLYDSWYYLKAGFPVSANLVSERTGKTLEDYLRSIIPFIRKTYTPRNVLQGLGEALDEKQKAWAKAHLISETIKEIKRRIP
jgi:predicted nucleotidyltransferase component of viral defense system